MNITSTTSVLSSPTSDLVSSSGTCLGTSMNNISEYHAVIGLLTKALASNVSQIRVYLDSKLVMYQLNRVYTIRNPVLLRMF